MTRAERKQRRELSVTRYTLDIVGAVPFEFGEMKCTGKEAVVLMETKVDKLIGKEPTQKHLILEAVKRIGKTMTQLGKQELEEHNG